MDSYWGEKGEHGSLGPSGSYAPGEIDPKGIFHLFLKH